MLTKDQEALAAQLRAFKADSWPVYKAHGWTSLDLAFHSHLMLQQVSVAVGAPATSLDVAKAESVVVTPLKVGVTRG